MRLIRIILIFIFVVGGLYLLACIFIPAKYQIERVQTVNAPTDIVFEQVASLKSWEQWSPLNEKDPDLKSLFSPNSGKEGSYWLWKGDRGGEGRMTITEIIDLQKIAYHLSIEKPYKSETDGYLSIVPSGNQTIVTWTAEGTNPFYLRVLNLMMDSWIGPDFEKGLTTLKTIVEKEANIFKNEYFGYRIKEMRYGGNKIGYIKKTILLDEIDAFFIKSNTKIITEAKNCNFKIDGQPMALFYRWDYANGVATIAAAIPVMGDSTLGDDIGLMQIQPQKALLLNYYGGYKSSEKAYTALDNYLKNKSLIKKSPVIEEYIIGPKQQRDSAKWHTKIWYLLQ